MRSGTWPCSPSPVRMAAVFGIGFAVSTFGMTCVSAQVLPGASRLTAPRLLAQHVDVARLSSPGFPSFERIVIDTNPPTTTIEKALADIDGDGHLDAIIGCGSPSNGGIFWYASPHSGVLTQHLSASDLKELRDRNA